MRNQLAKEIANALLLDLKVGRIPKLGIEEIQAEISARLGTGRDSIAPLGSFARDQLEQAVTRAVVEGAS